MTDPSVSGPYTAPRNMNWGAVALSGLAASIVILVAVYVAGLMGQELLELGGPPAAFASTDPAIPAAEPVPGARVREIVFSLLWVLGVGALIACAYASVRPRFGPGAVTALRVGVFFGLVIQGLGILLGLAGGVPIMATDIVTRVFSVVAYILAALVAGFIYWETPETRHRRESGRWPTST